MKKILVFNWMLITYSSCCMSQSLEFNQLINAYQKNLDLPIDLVHHLQAQDTISKSLLNWVLFEQQKERAKFYSIKDSLYKVTTYGKIPEKLFDYETWKKENGEVKWYKKIFFSKAYAVGYVSIKEEYHALITKVVAFETTYYDLYLFDKNGKLKSLVNLYEAEYKRVGQPEEISEVYIQSSISKEGIIKRHEERFGVTTDREYQLQPDGYFKITNENIEGKFEY